MRRTDPEIEQRIRTGKRGRETHDMMPLGMQDRRETRRELAHRHALAERTIVARENDERRLAIVKRLDQ